MKSMEELRDLLCDELDKIAMKGELTAGSLDTIDKLTHSIKSIDTIMAMEGESYDNYQDGSYRSYARGGGRSYRRDSMGRYSRRGYSRDDEIEDRLMDIMQDIKDPKVRQHLEKAIEKMEG